MSDVDERFEQALRNRHTADKTARGVANHGPCEVCFCLARLDVLRASLERVTRIVNDEAGLSDYHASRATLLFYETQPRKIEAERDSLRASLEEAIAFVEELRRDIPDWDWEERSAFDARLRRWRTDALSTEADSGATV